MDIFKNLLGPSTAATPSKGLLGDPQSQMMLGLSLLNAGGPSLTPKSGFEGVPQTMALLQRQQMLRDEQEREAKQREASAAAMSKLGIDPNLPSGIQTAQYNSKFGAPKNPKDYLMEVDGQIYDTRNQTWLEGPANAAPKIDKDALTAANALRDDYRTDTATDREVLGGARQIMKLAQDPEGAAVSHYAAAVSFAKILDPGSVAREGEVSAIANNGSLPEVLKASIINALTGKGKMPPEVLNEIARISAVKANESLSGIQSAQTLYGKRAGLANIDPLLIYDTGRDFTPFEVPKPFNKTAPAATGTAPNGNGYRVIGEE